MAILEDPDDATPTSITNMIGQRLCTMTHISTKGRLTYAPKHVPWLYCRDSTTLDDRWEMPGDFMFASVDTAEALFPGYVMCHFDVEFDILVSSNLNVATLLALRGVESPDGEATFKGPIVEEDAESQEGPNTTRIINLGGRPTVHSPTQVNRASGGAAPGHHSLVASVSPNARSVRRG